MMISEAVHNAIMTLLIICGVTFISGLSSKYLIGGAYVCEYFNKSGILNLLEPMLNV